MKQLAEIFINILTALSGMIIYGGIVIYSRECSAKPALEWKCWMSAMLATPADYALEGLNSLKRLSPGILMSGHGVPDNNESIKRFGDLKKGFNFYARPSPDLKHGYLLLSYRDVQIDIPAVELWDLSKQILLHKWQMNEVCKRLTGPGQYCGAAFSPVVLPDKSLIFNTQGWGDILIKINKEGKIIAKNDFAYFHHKILVDPSGDIYATYSKKNKYHDHSLGWSQGVAVLDQNLRIKKEILIHKIYEGMNITSRLYSANSDDPVHVNDVEVISHEGDKLLLMNLRSTSSLILYNLTKNYPIWILDGITKQGHDVDIISVTPFKISIFDNNVYSPQENQTLNQLTSFGNRVIFITGLPLRLKKSEVRIYTPLDVRNDLLAFSIIDFKAMRFPPKTITSGLSDYNKLSDSLIVEESNHGRIFSYNIKKRAIEWEYINKNMRGNVFGQMSWSTYYARKPVK